MKARQVLFFILGVFLMLGAAWAVFPAEGVRFGTKRLRFASYAGHVRDAKEKKVDVDSVLNALDGRFAMLGDTFDFYRQFFYENPDRIYLPNDDYTFFDPVFRAFEQARKEGRTVRVAHYGDSQIELDRISSNLREGWRPSRAPPRAVSSPTRCSEIPPPAAPGTGATAPWRR